MRLIDADWLLDVVENIIDWDTERDRNRIIHQVRELTPTVDAEPHWIPVTEKPIPKGLVLVTYNDGDVDLLRQPTAYRRGDIVAWCNRPEPYKGVTT